MRAVGSERFFGRRWVPAKGVNAQGDHPVA
jgi:hypothetical protein